MAYVSSCSSGTCGQNAQCSIIGGRPVCSCFRGYLGDPLSLCKRAECLDNSECRGHLTCRNGRCIDPCEGTCGANAICNAKNHLPVCSCPAGYTGDPFSHCRHFDPCKYLKCRKENQVEVFPGIYSAQTRQRNPLGSCYCSFLMVFFFPFIS
jgi:hypothetical protein